VKGRTRLTPEIVALVHGIALGLGERATSTRLRERLESATRETWSEATVRRAMVEAGVARPEGRPRGTMLEAEPHPRAGAELLLAVDQELGATEHLAVALHAALERLPEPSGEVRDDTANRDENGRFLPGYNVPSERTEPELGAKFDSVTLRRPGKGLRTMQAAKTSTNTLARKLRALTMLPCVTDSPRWEALRHWEGDTLEALVGVGYKPATLDKILRELKYADVSGALVEASAGFWVVQEGLGEQTTDGMALVYADTAIKSVWTHHFTRCAKVSSRGRVMPAISTMYLHVGPGTPILFRSFSGTASLPAEIPALLREYEQIAGEGTVRRVVVIDREGASVGFMKRLKASGWHFVIPLRKSVTGPSARFEELTEWSPYKDAGDEVQGGWLWLNDTNDRSNPLRVRVVARRRHRTGKVAWYATTTDPVEVPDTTVIDRYFDRWPLQEHRFRDGNSRVHLDKQHGYGKRKVDNVAVLDRRELLAGQLRRAEVEIERLGAELSTLREEQASVTEALAVAGPGIDRDRAALDQQIARGEMTAQVQRSNWAIGLWETWRETKRGDLRELEQRVSRVEAAVASAEATRASKQADLERTESQTRIFTVDVALDQVMTALKLTFMNLCAAFMARYLGGAKLQLDTLIRGILTLPGERVRTASTETIRIYRHHRDRELMPLVEEACRLLTARELTRDGRRLRFELVDRPNGRAGPGRATPADTA
jgi:hypothetical protein